MFGDYQIRANFSKSVYLALHKPSMTYVALKRISLDNCDEEFKEIQEEVGRVSTFQHANIIKIHSSFVSDCTVNIVYSFYCFGSCKEAMKNFFFTGFPELVCVLILRDILTALDYLHRRGIIHRSVRASHVLLNQTHAVLSGFRSSTSLLRNGERLSNLHSLPTGSAKSINWLAAEVLEQNLLGYSEKSDIYSVGITACELANGIAPFADLSSTLMLTEKIRGNQPSLLDSSTFPSDEIIAQAMDSGIGIGEAWAADQTRQIYSSRNLSDSFHKFAEMSMTRYPENRPNASQLLTQHAFFKQCKHTTLEEQLKNVLEPVDFDKISTENLALKPSNDDLSMNIESLSINDPVEWDF